MTARSSLCGFTERCSALHRPVISNEDSVEVRVPCSSRYRLHSRQSVERGLWLSAICEYEPAASGSNSQSAIQSAYALSKVHCTLWAEFFSVALGEKLDSSPEPDGSGRRVPAKAGSSSDPHRWWTNNFPRRDCATQYLNAA